MTIKYRKLKEEDLHDLAEILGSEMVCLNTPFGPNTVIETMNYFKPLLDDKKSSELMNYIIAILNHNKVIGNIGIFTKSANNDCFEIGYNLAPEYWNKGIMSNSISRICKILKQKKSAKFITAKVMSSNLASFKVLEKTGFKISYINFNSIEKRGKKFDEITMKLIF